MPRKHARKAWVKIETSLLYEPWDRDVKMTLVLLILHLNDRWAREGLTAEEACRSVLSWETIFLITGRHRRDFAEKSLRRLEAICSLTVSGCGDNLEIYWPKFAKTQHLGGLYAPPTATPEEALGVHNEDEDEDEDENTTLVSERGSESTCTNSPQPANEGPSAPHSLSFDFPSGEKPPAPDAQLLIERVDVTSLRRQLQIYGGTPASVRTWLAKELPLIVLEVYRDEKTTPRNFEGGVVVLSMRYRRAYLKDPRTSRPKGYQSAAEKTESVQREIGRWAGGAPVDGDA